MVGPTNMNTLTNLVPAGSKKQIAIQDCSQMAIYQNAAARLWCCAGLGSSRLIQRNTSFEASPMVGKASPQDFLGWMPYRFSLR
jgi:hypothetical protein